MQTLEFDRDTVISRLTANRDAHRQIFEEAIAGYREAVIRELDRSLADARSGRKIRTYIELVEPVDRTGDYDAIIDMLESTTETVIQLSPTEFRQYMRDEWSWREQFIVSNAQYSQTAAGLMHG